MLYNISSFSTITSQFFFFYFSSYNFYAHEKVEIQIQPFKINLKVYLK